MSRSPRRRAEVALALVFAAVITIAGGAVIFLVSTMAVHTDPAAVPSTAAAVPPERFSAAVEESRRLARALVVGNNLPGLSVAVAVDGGTVWAEDFGWADLESRVPVTPGTRFRLGSVSKTLTGAAVALLHERRRIDFDAPPDTLAPRVGSLDGLRAGLEG